MKPVIRLVKPDDSEAILRIYAPYVRNTTISFETEVPSVFEFAGRIAETGSRFPYLVLTDSEAVVGFAYAANHNVRRAYRFDANLSLYLDPAYQGSGIAALFYSCFLDILRTLGYYTVYAIIALPNDRSVRFHQKFGFSCVGTFRNAGYKLGEWHDVLWMDKQINEIKADGIEPRDPLLIGDLSAEYLDSVFCEYASRIYASRIH